MRTNGTPREIREYTSAHMRKRKWLPIVTGMAAVVVFCTVYMLILPAITLEKDQTLNCVYSIHRHEESCYDDNGGLICGYADYVIHTHQNDHCYDADGNLICELPEMEVHEHDSSCYEEQSALVCETTENDGHVHDESCYESVQGALICGDEDEGHEHDASCYEWSEELICGMETGEGAHQHGEECYESRTVLICDRDEVILHTHSADCYDAEGNLTCGLLQTEEHHHDQSCVEQTTEETEAVPEAQDSYTYEDASVSAAAFFQDGSFLPENTVLKVNRMDPESGENEAYRDTAILTARENGKLPAELALYDIGFYTSDGTRLSVSETAEVTITFKEAVFAAEETPELAVLRYEDADTASALEGAACQLSEEGRLNKVSFTMPGFSVFAVMTLKEEDGISTLSVLPDTVVATGSFGENDCLTWTVTEDDLGVRTLTISGEGNMPNFAKAEYQPWRDYYTTINKIVIKDDVKSIGDHAFQNLPATEVSIGSGVTSIGTLALGYMTSLTEITIPENVKTLGTAFQYSNKLAKVTLEEGIESVNLDAFTSTAIGSSGSTIDIPASVTAITGNSGNAAAYTVAAGNRFYMADEAGALYKVNGDGTRTLAAYPAYGKATSYTIPDDVTAITATFAYNQTLLNLTIPDTVTANIPSQCFRDSNLVRVEIENGVKLPETSYLFNNCKYLEEVTLPDSVTVFYDHMFYGCSSLGAVRVGKNVTQINANAMTGCTSLENFYYDADTCAKIGSIFDSGLPIYNLVIGKDVNVLPQTVTEGEGEQKTIYPGFAAIAGHAQSITFEGPTWITVEQGALSTAPAPLNTLAGTIYVDEMGVIYLYDAAAGTAALVYCPDGLNEVTVPDTIPTEDGMTCKVNRIEKYAFSTDTSLEKVIFKDVTCITTIGERAFYRCENLRTIVDEKSQGTAVTVKQAEDLFTKASIGRKAFEATGLTTDQEDNDNLGTITDSNMDGSETLKIGEDLTINVASGGNTMQWKDKAEEEKGIGGHHLLTGDSLTATITVSNESASADTVYRVYFELTEESGTLSAKAGTSYDVEGTIVTCHGTDDSHIVYIEFEAASGKTLNIPVTASYPSPGSSGGALRIWGFEYDSKSGTGELGEDVVVEPDRSSDTIQAYWTTKPAEFELTKNFNGQPAVALAGDGHGGAVLAANLTWKISLIRNTEQSTIYGKDYVSLVDYTDTMTLPAGVSWKPEVLTAVQDKRVRRSGDNLYAGNILIGTFTPGSNTVISKLSARLDDSNNVVIDYSVRKTVSGDEMPDNNITATIHANALAVDLEAFNESADAHTVQNAVSADLHYNYSAVRSLSAATTKTLNINDAKVELKKEGTDTTYFGEDITYTLSISNAGTAEYPLVTSSTEGNELTEIRLEDTLAKYTYIKPENIDKMLAESEGHYSNLVVTITGAVLAPQTPVTSYDGQTTGSGSYTNSANSDLLTTSGTVSIKRNTDKNAAENARVIVTVEFENSTSEYRAATAVEALRQAGYAVNGDDRYTVTWALQNGAAGFHLQGGEERRFYIYATAMDTFQMLKKDEHNEYFAEAAIPLTNTAKVIETYSASGEKTIATATKPNAVKREIYLEKSVSRNGQKQPASFSAETGDLLEYDLVFRHHGSGEYRDLPLVDDMYGAQYLLVPAAVNTSLQDRGLEIWTNKETQTEYYKLAEGEYKNVVVGVDDEGTAYTAAVITVTKASEETEADQDHSYIGLHTQIKWYYPEVGGGNYETTVTYQALTDTSLGGRESYTIGNIVWLNDKRGKRLYDSLWGGGTIVGFEKNIVVERGEAPEKDLLAEDKYSLIGAGDSVTYQLKLYNKGEWPYTLPGSALGDALPNTGGIFKWGEDNVSIEVFADEGVNVEGIEDGWSIEQSFGSLAETEGQYYIVWDNDAKIEYTGKQNVYIYVTLKFPSNTEERALWDDYCDKTAGDILENTLYVYRYPSNVIHHLKEKGEVLLQKGVYGTYYYDDTITGAVWVYETPSRINYNNRDHQGRAVAYYVALYNDGNKRLYLDDLYDILPEGFTFKAMLDAPISGSAHTTPFWSVTASAASKWAVLPDDAIQKSAQVTATMQEEGMLRFQLTGDTSDTAIHYDSDQERWYLDTNEAVVFGYLCDIDVAARTKEHAENIIGMGYVDIQGSGVEEAEVFVSGAITDTYLTANDGECEVLTYGAAKGLGLPAKDGEWLVSRVTVSRGNIVPGVTKRAESYVDKGGTTQDYSNSVLPYYAVNWRSSLTNSGEYSITDYTIEDIMPCPYVFEGDVKLEIYNSSSSGTPDSSGTLFTIAGREADDDHVSLTYNISPTQTASKKLVFGEEWKDTIYFGKVMNDVSIKLERDNDGNEVLTLVLSSRYFSIPAGGKAELIYTSRNPTSSYNNKTYNNQVILTPNQQEFERAGHGSLVKDENGKVISVRNYGPVTVAFGYTTSSDKRVTETDTDGALPENTASASDVNHNYIVMQNTSPSFRYDLSVTNNSDLAMTELVLIDNLPDVGDTTAFDTTVSRGSEFKVILAEEPRFQVTVSQVSEGDLPTPNVTTLNTEQYTLEYGTETSFTTDDWAGSNTGRWSSSVPASEARSFRIVIKDETAALIPKGSTVTVSFNAEIYGTPTTVPPAPGSIAWNSFGYSYKVDTPSPELSLSALSLPVGIKVAEIPTLRKTITSLDGKPVTLETDRMFSFYLYTGEYRKLAYSTEYELAAALGALQKEDADFLYERIQVKVPAGESESELVYLTAGQNWIFAKGKTYTIIEAPADTDFTDVKWNDTNEKHWTFIYDPDEPVALNCTNQGIFAELPMTGGTGTNPFTISGLLIMAGAVGWGYRLRRRRERRAGG